MQEGEKVVISEQDFRRRFVYDHTNLLGEGGFAKVYQAYDRQFEETVALKFYTNTDAQKYDIISEMRNSRRFTHKNIIRVHDARIVRFTNSFGLTEDVQVGILEYANAGNLQDFLKTSPSEEEFKEVIKEILQGLHYLHTEKRVIHRDLSPDNILMVKERNTWIPKIADFGISKEIDLKTLNVSNKKVSSELVGKMEYMAPEQFDPKKYGINQQIATNVDLWSFGVILTEIFTDKSPFGDRNTSQSPMEIMHNVLHNPLPSEIKGIPEPYRQIITKCLVKDAKKRAQSSMELMDILLAPIPTKRKTNKIWVAGAFVLLILLAFGIWYALIPSNEGTKIVKRENTPNITKEAEGNASEQKKTISPTIDTSNAKLVEKGSKDSSNNNLPEDTVNILPSFPEKPRFEKSLLFNNLLQRIKIMDNDAADSILRISRIEHYISDYFVGTEARVLIDESDSVRDQSVEDFFKYVVNTSGIETREWRIDTTQTRLSGKKVSTLYLKKY